MFFHIQAGVYEMSADLAATIGWVHHPDLKEFYRDYARRRFGTGVADTLARSIDIFCDAVDLRMALSPVCFRNSGEDLLGNCELTGHQRKEWIKSQMQKYQKHADMAARAARLARSVPNKVREERLSNTYFWELDYVGLRFDGILALYRSHLLADTDPEQADEEFQKALNAFLAIKEMFRGSKEISMDQLWDLEPDVPFTDSYRANWESRGFWGGGRADDAQVVWERFDIFEAKLRALRPAR